MPSDGAAWFSVCAPVMEHLHSQRKCVQALPRVIGRVPGSVNLYFWKQRVVALLCLWILSHLGWRSGPDVCLG